MDKEASIKDIMAAAAPVAGLNPASECFVAGNLAEGALHVTFLSNTHKARFGRGKEALACCCRQRRAALPFCLCLLDAPRFPSPPPRRQVTDRESKHLKLALWRVPKPADKDKGASAPNYARELSWVQASWLAGRGGAVL